MKRIILFSVFIISVINAKSQSVESPNYFLEKIRKMVYVSPDTTMFLFQRITQEGGGSFCNGYSNFSDFYRNSSVFHTTVFVRNKKAYYKVKVNYDSVRIDTVKSFFPVKMKNSYKSEFSQRYDDVNYSYVLKQLGESGIVSSTPNTIRMIYFNPYKSDFDEFFFISNPCSYHVVTVTFFADSAKLYYSFGRSVDIRGLQLVRKDSCLLKKKDVDKIMKEMSLLNSVASSNCLESYCSWLLEFNTDYGYRYFSTYHYEWSYKKEFKPAFRLWGLLLYLASKYVKINS